ncbi:hypothetical protein [Motilibacter aurantiacus]|uniref:hypothetical protein n=1 Tax=Motilibacter aurantiacus TaxID=2714955 RepID=UPI0014079268|nr:hypothetical protein [Motilibacter aurantiacus]NHC44327.1 hypothetical protein [Motilibacter aurantiacus]
MNQFLRLDPRETLASPVQPAAEATEAYGRSLAVLSAAERALTHRPTPEVERAVLTASEYVLACRVQACRALLTAGVRLPSETLHHLDIDEELVGLPARGWLPPVQDAARAPGRLTAR